MCTSLLFKDKHSYFLRNMDLDYSFNEQIIIVPRNYKLTFKRHNETNNHYAFLAIGCIVDNYPLIADGINEKGIAIAALNFKDNAFYYKENKDKNNFAPYEFMLYILATCSCIDEVKEKLNNINIIDIAFNKDIPTSPLHFMISDKNSSIVVETLKDKMYVYDNPYNVLTNNPPFYYHVENVKNYLNLSIEDPFNKIVKDINIKPYSYNMGLMGLPGDYSSTSRFIKALIIKSNILIKDCIINSMFYILNSVFMINGLVKTNLGYEYTRYSCVIDIDNCIYYYKTYDNNNIKIIKLNDYNLSTSKLIAIKI